MDSEREGTSIPILDSITHERWFRKMIIFLRARGVLYVVEQSIEEFARIVGPEDGVPEITKGVASLGLDKEKTNRCQLNLEKKSTWLKDDAIALSIIMSRLTEDDEALVDEYPSAKSLWAHLTGKYSMTNPVAANENLTAIQTFNFDQYGSVMTSWDKLKEFRRKLGAANPNMRMAYTDESLYLVLQRSLPPEYTTTIDGLIIQTSLTVEERLKHLESKENRMKASVDQAHASFKPRDREFIPSQHLKNYSSSSEGAESSRGKCLLCDSRKHWLRKCPHLEYARNSVKERNERKQVRFKRPNSPHQRSRSKSNEDRFKRPSTAEYNRQTHRNLKEKFSDNTKSYIMKEENSDSEIDFYSDDEVCALNKEQIKLVPPTVWPSDTACTSHMSDKRFLFSQLTPIKRRCIRVGGGMMFADFRGVAKLVYEDGSSTLLPDALYVPGLGVNLLSAKRLCEAGLKGSFDDKSMYFKMGNKIMVHSKMDQGLYIVKHVSKELDGLIAVHDAYKSLSAIDIDPVSTNTKLPSHRSNNQLMQNHTLSSEYLEKEIGKTDLDRYILWHKRFSHLGPDKLRNLHKVTTLREAIKVPKIGEVCEVCQLTKMTNRIPNSLSEHKDQRLALIHLDVAGPFPKSLRGNRYFMLIVDSYSRKNWILLLKQKSDAPGCLRTFKLVVEKEIGEKIKAVRTDNAPELLHTVDLWKKQDGVEIQSTVTASSHQNGAAERNIRTAEANMRSMLKEAGLPLEFWDEAVETEAYIRNRTATGPSISNCVTSPQEAWSGKIPSIDHIRVWGSKCYSYINPKTIPSGHRGDKLIDRGRIGVFMGYSLTTDKQFRVYSPELGYTTRVSIIKVDESTKGGTIELRLRDCNSGSQGTLNFQPDRKKRGRPAANTDKDPSTIQPTTPIIVSQTDILSNKIEDSLSQSPTENLPDISDKLQTPLESEYNTQKSQCQSHPSSPTIEKICSTQHTSQDTPTKSSESLTIDNINLVPASDIILGTKRNLNSQNNKDEFEAKRNPCNSKNDPRLRYFTRGAKRRSNPNEILEDDQAAKRIRAMIAQLQFHENDLDQFERAFTAFAFPTQTICGVAIPRTYQQAINDEKWGKSWRQAINNELTALVANQTWKEVIPPPNANLISAKWVFTVKTKSDGSID